MATIANLQTLVTADTSNYVKNIDKAEKRGESFVRSLSGMKRTLRNVATGFGIERALHGLGNQLDNLQKVGERLGTSELGKAATEAHQSWEKLQQTWRKSADTLIAQMSPAIKSVTDDLNAMMRGRNFDIAEGIHKDLMGATTFKGTIEAEERRVKTLTVELERAEQRISDLRKSGAMFTDKFMLMGMVGKVKDALGMNRVTIALRDAKALKEQLQAAQQVLNRLEDIKRLNPNATTTLEREEAQQKAAEARLKGMLTSGVASAKVMGRGLFSSIASGASSAFSDAIIGADKLQKKLDELKKAGKDVFDATRTPLEEFEARLKKLKELLELGKKAGGIDQDTFDRAMAMALQDLDRATNVAATDRRPAIAALEKGTAAAFAAERDQGDPTEKTQKEILEQAEKFNANLAATNAALLANAAKPAAFPKGN